MRRERMNEKDFITILDFHLQSMKPLFRFLLFETGKEMLKSAHNRRTLHSKMNDVVSLSPGFL